MSSKLLLIFLFIVHVSASLNLYKYVPVTIEEWNKLQFTHFIMRKLFRSQVKFFFYYEHYLNQ